MEKITKEIVYDLANQLMFSLSEKEANDIVAEFATLLNQLSLLEAIDTHNVEEMIYPFEEKTYYMREDIAIHVLSTEDVLSNAPLSKDGYFVIPKVVKD